MPRNSADGQPWLTGCDLSGLRLAAVERTAEPPRRRPADGFHRTPEVGGGGLVGDVAQLTVELAVA